MKLNLFLVVCSLIVTFLLAEVGAQLGYYLKKGIPFSFNYESLQDSELGWTGKAVMGELNSPRTKILFIGDSFTEGLTVAPSDMYYTLVGQILDAEVFAYGGLGYGTLQELIILKRLLPQIKPDLVVLQVCSNDLLNNSWELEKRSFQQNAAMLRPYYENNQIQFRFPGMLGQTRVFLDAHSRAFHFVFAKWENLLLKLSIAGYLTSVEQEIARQGLRMPEVREALNTTTELVKQMKEATGSIPLFAFLIDGVEPNGSILQQAFKNNNLVLFDEVPKALKAQQKQKVNTRLPDGAHLNEEGNRVVAETIVEELENLLKQHG